MKKIQRSEAHLKEVKDAIDLASRLVRVKGIGDLEGFMVSMHFLKDGVINHTFSYKHFPADDFDICMVAMQEEGDKARSRDASEVAERKDNA